MDSIRVCPDCHTPKPITDYNWRNMSKGKRQTYCPPCQEKRVKISRRRRRTGTLLKRPTFEERFWSRVVKQDGCWGWTGRTSHGYGKIYAGWINGKKSELLASRVSYKMAYGPIPEGMEVCHRCDNPPCTRPDHLFLGTHADNIRDMWTKGRGSWGGAAGRRGESNFRAKLTDEKVRQIRRWHAEGHTGASIARELGASPQLVNMVLKGHIWTHVS